MKLDGKRMSDNINDRRSGGMNMMGGGMGSAEALGNIAMRDKDQV